MPPCDPFLEGGNAGGLSIVIFSLCGKLIWKGGTAVSRLVSADHLLKFPSDEAMGGNLEIDPKHTPG